MLEALRDREEGLLALVTKLAGTSSLAQLALVSSWTRVFALKAAEQVVRELISTERCVSRWRRDAYQGGSDVFREAHDIDRAAMYIRRAAGRYRLSGAVVLDISPSGDFVNYSTGSIDVPPGFMAYGEAQAGHCFRGITTIAGVRTVAGHGDFLYLLDRWYTACWQSGHEVAAESLGFVGPGYQCYSASALQEGGVQAGQSTPVLYENRPGPDAVEAWRVPRREPVHWRPLPGESLFDHLPSFDLSELDHLGLGDGQPANHLEKVAVRLEVWPEGGLAPLTDTRDDQSLRARYPGLQHYDPRLADLR